MDPKKLVIVQIQITKIRRIMKYTRAVSRSNIFNGGMVFLKMSAAGGAAKISQSGS